MYYNPAIIILGAEQLIIYGHNLYSFKIMKARDLSKPFCYICDFKGLSHEMDLAFDDMYG